jgi:TfoX/Sxy family transcriptional regulator of competence genes
MAWVKVPPENKPLFLAALPRDPRVETQAMFGGIAAKVNGHIFAGLFGLSTMLALDGPDEAAALALPGAERFDPMGDGRAMSKKVMLPVEMMDEPAELKQWIGRAFTAAAALPPKLAKPKKTTKKPSKKLPKKA